MKTKAQARDATQGVEGLSQEKPELDYSYEAEEALRGECLGARMRRLFMSAGVLVLALDLLAQRQVMGSRWGLVMLAAGLSYDFWLRRRLRQGHFLNLSQLATYPLAWTSSPSSPTRS